MNSRDSASGSHVDPATFASIRKTATDPEVDPARPAVVQSSPVGAGDPGQFDSPEEGLSALVEQAQIRIMLASYSDILFVTMPFLLVLVLRLFRSPPLEVLARPEWALASAVLAGLAVVKLMLGLVSHEKMHRHREKLVFMVAATTFLLLMPSLLLAGIANVMDAPPGFLVYIHPALLVIAIAVYSGAVQTSQMLLKTKA